MPIGMSSRDTNGRSMSPGGTGSSVDPHRYWEKSSPGSSSTLVCGSPAAIAALACFQYSGIASGRLRFGSTNRPRNSGDALAIARTTTRTYAAGAIQRGSRPKPAGWRARRRRASSAPASSTAKPSTSSGTARGVERRASPLVDPSWKALKSPPSGDGSS